MNDVESTAQAQSGPFIRLKLEKQMGFDSPHRVRYNAMVYIGQNADSGQYFICDVNKDVPEGEREAKAKAIFRNLISAIAKKADDWK